MSVSTGFRQIHIRHLGELVLGPGRNMKIASAPVFSGSRRGDEVLRLVMRISGRGRPKRPWPVCGTARIWSSRTPCESISMSNSTVGVPVSAASDGNAGLRRAPGMRGPGRRVWVAEVSGPERILAPDPAGAGPICDPVPEPVGIGRAVWVGCGFHWVASGFGLG